MTPLHKHHYVYETYDGNDRLVCEDETCTYRWPHADDLNQMEDIFEAIIGFFYNPSATTTFHLMDTVNATGIIEVASNG